MGIADDLQGLARRLREPMRGDFVAWDALQQTTWTPQFIGTTIAGTFTYASQLGIYVRLGPICYFEFLLTISAITVAPTGNMEISGLPFTISGVSAASVTLGRVSNLVYPAGALEIQALVTSNTVRLFYTRTNAAVVAYPAASFTNAACTIIGSGWYLV